MRNVAPDVREAVVPGAGHWLMEESPAATVALIEVFLKDRSPASALWPVQPTSGASRQANSNFREAQDRAQVARAFPASGPSS
jgi:hypothetical protein